MLRHLPTFDDPNLIFGYDTVGDAGVYKLRDDLAIIQTVDILTPIADDPYTFGEIAAANSLSDVYVMGGKPVTALNIVGFPEKKDLEILQEIIRGGIQTIKDAGAVVLGGHTIKDEDLKYGLAITAVVHPDEMITNEHARPGDQLILTKPIGTGVISTALKRGKALDVAVAKINQSMRMLNRSAAEAMVEVGVHACTDVTGFGLLGHALQMAQASRVSFRIRAAVVPLFDEALDYARKGFWPGGTKKNYQFVQSRVVFADDVDETMRLMLCDAQTSGGLLIAVPPARSELLMQRLQEKGTITCANIGKAIPPAEHSIEVVR